MKATSNIKIGLLIMVALLEIGCGKGFEAASNNNGVGVQGIPVVPSTYSGNPSLPKPTNSVDFSPVSLGEMNNYVAIYPLNDPQNFKVTVNLKDVGNGKFAGTVKISYTDTGVPHVGTFTADSRTNPTYSGLKDNGVLEAEYNRWFKFNNKDAFTGFFQDSIGAVVLVVDDVQDLGDAQGGVYLNGSVWYRNFAQSLAPAPFDYRKCWFVYDGPYQCRSSVVINKSGVSIDGYTKLGTFSGLSKLEAFK